MDREVHYLHYKYIFGFNELFFFILPTITSFGKTGSSLGNRGGGLLNHWKYLRERRWVRRVQAGLHSASRNRWHFANSWNTHRVTLRFSYSQVMRTFGWLGITCFKSCRPPTKVHFSSRRFPSVSVPQSSESISKQLEIGESLRQNHLTNAPVLEHAALIKTFHYNRATHLT